MVNPKHLEKIVEKYKKRLDSIQSSLESVEKSHFAHISRNLLGVMSLYADVIIKNYEKGDFQKLSERKGLFLQYSDSLRSYLNMIESNESFKTAEMKTSEGYLGETSYGSPNLYVNKLKERDELK